MNRAQKLAILIVTTLVAAGVAPDAFAAPAPTPGQSSTLEPLQFASTKHKHKWVKVPTKVWIPPKYKKVLIGKDKKGRPKYAKKKVSGGYYKTKYTTKCNVCGKKG